ncbi:MAG: hypothetical protein V4731_11615 [Pseudomonadota bacterium]
MYLIIIAWSYVVLLMSVAEATNPAGTLLGAIITFLLYGLLPMSVVVYVMRSPARKRANKLREAQEAQEASANFLRSGDVSSREPDAGTHPAGGAEAVAPGTSIAPVRKEP